MLPHSTAILAVKMETTPLNCRFRRTAQCEWLNFIFQTHTSANTLPEPHALRPESRSQTGSHVTLTVSTFRGPTKKIHKSVSIKVLLLSHDLDAVRHQIQLG
jgi:uncharacterized Zn-finger protein